MIRNTTAVLLGLTLLVGLAGVQAACSGLGKPSIKDEKFAHAISETFEENPGLVVDLVDETVEALQLQIRSRVLTSIDGRFEVRSAMGDDYRVVVEGLLTSRTRVEIDMATERNLAQAQLIMTEIRSRILSLRANPGPQRDS